MLEYLGSVEDQLKNKPVAHFDNLVQYPDVTRFSLGHLIPNVGQKDHFIRAQRI
jgi:hypothetical protein